MTRTELGQVLEELAEHKNTAFNLVTLGSRSAAVALAIAQTSQLVRESVGADLVVPLPGPDQWFGQAVGKASGVDPLMLHRTNAGAIEFSSGLSAICQQAGRVAVVAGILDSHTEVRELLDAAALQPQETCVVALWGSPGF